MKRKQGEENMAIRPPILQRGDTIGLVTPGSPLDANIINNRIQYLRDLGFNLRKVENEAAPYHLRKRLPFVQEFEFYPTGGQFRGKLDELEVVISNISNHGVELLLEVDRRARGLGGFLSEALEIDESMVKVMITQGDQASISRTLENVIQRYS